MLLTDQFRSVLACKSLCCVFLLLRLLHREQTLSKQDFFTVYSHVQTGADVSVRVSLWIAVCGHPKWFCLSYISTIRFCF